MRRDHQEFRAGQLIAIALLLAIILVGPTLLAEGTPIDPPIGGPLDSSIDTTTTDSITTSGAQSTEPTGTTSIWLWLASIVWAA
jgi:hypothetical protein